jgi:hypothetical protein
MKIILSESQVERLVSEQMLSFMSPFAGPLGVKSLLEMDPHDRNALFSFAAAFVPIIGPALSLGIAAYDAKTYLQQGKKKEAGLSLFLALLPGIGAVVSKIPGIKQLGAKGMSALAKKIIAGGKNLTPLENEIMRIVSNNKQIYSYAKDEIKSKMTSAGYDVVTGQKKV